MADWELSQLAVRATPAVTDYVPLLVPTDTSTPPADAFGSDQRATIPALVKAAIDTTAADIAASPGTQAAGAVGKPADSGHVHPQPPFFAPTGLTGAVQAARFAGATASGAPVSGTFATGDFIVDQTGIIWLCTSAGSPGTWVALYSTAGGQAIAGNLIVNNPSHYANGTFVGQSDGAQYSNFNLADNVYPLDGLGHYWAFSHRFDAPAHRLVIFNYNGSAYTNAVQITEAGAVSTLHNTLEDGNGNATFAGTVTLPAGTTSLAPLKLTSGTVLTSPAAGAAEYDGAAAYLTNETTSGRGLVPVEQRFRLTAAGSAISTIANYFGTTSNISLVSGAEYEIEIDCWFLKTTAGTVTWTFTNSAAPASMTIDYQLSPATGIVTTAAATDLFGQQYNVTATAPTVVSASLTTAVNHRHRFKIRLVNGTGTSLKIQATAGAGTITPGINSYWKAVRVPAANVGTFAA